MAFLNIDDNLEIKHFFDVFMNIISRCFLRMNLFGLATLVLAILDQESDFLVLWFKEVAAFSLFLNFESF